MGVCRKSRVGKMWSSPRQEPGWHSHTVFGGRQLLSCLTLRDSCRTDLKYFPESKTWTVQLMRAEQKRMVSKVTHHNINTSQPINTPHWALKDLLLAQWWRAIWDLFSQLHENLDLGLSLATLLQLLNSIPVANCLDWLWIAQGCKVKDVLAELKLNNTQAALVAEEEMSLIFLPMKLLRNHMSSGICGT